MVVGVGRGGGGGGEQKSWAQLSIEEHMNFYEEQGLDTKEAMKKVD